MKNNGGYQIVGRYTSGREVVAYQVQEIDTGKSRKYTKEQVCFLVGSGRISNCRGQIHNDKVVLRGVGISLNSLPTVNDEGNVTRTDSVGHIRRKDTATDIMNKLMLVGSIMDGKTNAGYVVRNAGGAEKNLKRQQVIELAKAGKIGNATVQTYKNRDILRGKGTNLRELPTINISKAAGGE